MLERVNLSAAVAAAEVEAAEAAGVGGTVGPLAEAAAVVGLDFFVPK